MQKLLPLVATVTVVGSCIAACGSTTTNPTNDSGIVESGTDDGATDSSAMESSTTDAGAKPVTLTVMNFLDWCSVSINGGAASKGATSSTSVTPGSVATIVVSPASSSFQIGADPWLGVDQNGGGPAPGVDMGSGTTETSTATVTITNTGTTQCVSVCCQEPNNSPTPCPTTNPCP